MEVVRSTSVAIACLFDFAQHVRTVTLKNRRTVNSDRYTSVCLLEIIPEKGRENRK